MCLPGLRPACGVPFCDGRSLDLLAERSLSINWEIAAQAGALCVFQTGSPPLSLHWVEVVCDPSPLQLIAGTVPPLLLPLTSPSPPQRQTQLLEKPKSLIFLLAWRSTDSRHLSFGNQVQRQPGACTTRQVRCSRGGPSPPLKVHPGLAPTWPRSWTLSALDKSMDRQGGSAHPRR